MYVPAILLCELDHLLLIVLVRGYIHQPVHMSWSQLAGIGPDLGIP